MRFRNLALLLLCLPLAAAAQQPLHMKITINGAPVGENVYTSNPDGSFSSKSTLDLGSIKITSTATGHIKDGKLVDATADTEGPASAKVVYAKGRVEMTAKGKTYGSPWQDKTGALVGSLHPQFDATSILIADKAIQSNPATKTTTVNSYLVDGGSVVPIKITSLPPKTVEVNGKSIVARRFALTIAGIDTEILLDEAGHVATQDVPSQHLRFVLDGWEGAFVDPMTKFPELSQATYKTKIEKGVHVRMRDGIELIADVIRPDDNEKHPAILVRTPYGRGSEDPGGFFYATRGYAYVTQDCRGREDSYGDWDPFVNEGPDGYDTIQWVAAQPWCDGNVGMIGGSYSGYVQWAAAVLDPPALKCIVPQVSPPDGMRNIPYDHGIFFLYGDLWWAQIVAGRRTDFSGLRSALPHPNKLDTLPLSKLDDAVLGEHLEFFDKWLSRPTLGDWKGMDFTYHLDDVHIPALDISGIWDGDEIGTHINWTTMRKLGRDNQWIIFGPWVHAFDTNHSFGDVEYGPDAIIDLDSVFLRWFDTWLKGKSVGEDKQPHVRLFVTGANKWVDYADWPDPSMTARTMYFAKDGLRDQVGDDESREYTYDPAKDKVPAGIGNAGGGEGTTKVGPENIKGGLILETPVLEKNTAISSPFNVKLYFKTSAKDTDFFVDVVDVDPKGVMRIVGQPGKIKASYIEGMDAERPLTPGQEYTAEITPWDFAHEFKKGHRIGLIVTSSMFPGYARNLGTGEPIKDATKMIVQRNTILMGKDHPSSFSFEVLWEK
ncbi:MAG TPA: CocE/NonD family hydrolase [Fimbriimonadaceae bacterium]|nr:CocE/NonD family hydrolase [Fimbriimonadaceae bacterium]